LSNYHSLVLDEAHTLLRNFLEAPEKFTYELRR
jgi:hypothetical protein